MGGFSVRFPWDKEVAQEDLGAHWFGRMLTALYFSTFMIRASFAIMLIAFPIYILGLKSYFLFGVVLASSPLFELITVIGLGAYIDKHGRKNVLLLGLLMGSLALFALLLTKDPIFLFAINAFHGISAAAILVSSLALIADYAPKKSRGKIMGAFDFVNLFGWIVGFGVGGLLIDTFQGNIGMTFVVAGVMGLVAWVWATLNVHEPKGVVHRTSEISFKMIASVIKQRNVVLLIAPWFIIYLLVSTMLTFTSKAGTQELGLTGTELALLLGGGGTLFLVTQVAYGWASDKYGRTKIMIVGTVGIVGIMLTVGSVFLTAPALIAPAGHTVGAANLDGDGQPEFLLQSDFGLYIIDDTGAVLREFGPPEGGFGTLHPFASSDKAVFSTHDSIQIISTETGAVTWVEEAREPSTMRITDVNLDGNPEIFYADEHGLHISGPALSSAGPLPAIPSGLAGAAVLDALWAGSDLYLLASNGSGVDIVGLSQSSPMVVPVGPDSYGLLPGNNLRAGTLIVLGASGGTEIQLASGSSVDWFPFPAGLKAATVWNGTSMTFRLIAIGPSGGGAIVFSRPAAPADPTIVTLPAGLTDARVVPWNGEALFAGYAPNGTLSSARLVTAGASTTLDSLTTHEIMVKRETAQSTFGKLTSPTLLVPIGIFALMAGAFGPAALAGLTDVSQTDKRGVTMGLYSVVISSSMIVGPIVTGYLVDNYGGFGVMAFLASSAAAMAILMAVRALDVRRQGGEEHILEMAREKEAKESKHDEEE